MNLHYDQVGTLRVVANRYGSVVKELLYDSFGILLEDDEPDMQLPFGFAGGLYVRSIEKSQLLGFFSFGTRGDVETTAVGVQRTRFGYRDYVRTVKRMQTALRS